MILFFGNGSVYLFVFYFENLLELSTGTLYLLTRKCHLVLYVAPAFVYIFFKIRRILEPWGFCRGPLRGARPWQCGEAPKGMGNNRETLESRKYMHELSDY